MRVDLLANVIVVEERFDNFAGSKISLSPISMPEKKSSLSGATACFCVEGWCFSEGSAFSLVTADCSRFWREPPKSRGRSGSSKPSRASSSSLSAVRQLDILGLSIDMVELRFERSSLLVPPERIPMLPSAHSASKSSEKGSGVRNTSARGARRKGSSSAGNSISFSKLSSSGEGSGGGETNGFVERRDFAILIVGTSIKDASSSVSLNRSRASVMGLCGGGELPK
jgi:hypothetical protein